jgi:stringent starvation protein B
MISTTPYLIRAIYDWCMDQGYTPHLLVDTSVEGVVVPQQLVENNAIVLNIQSTAVRSLEMGNEWLMFNARFSGNPMEVIVPVSAIRAIFARENGQGCVFEAQAEPVPGEAEPALDESAQQAQEEQNQKQDTQTSENRPEPKKSGDKKSHLKLV